MFYEELSNLKHLCAHRDIFSEPGNAKRTRTTVRNVNFVLLRMSQSLKVPYTSRPVSYIVPSTELRFFSGEGGGGAYRKGALIPNSKP